MGLVKYYGGKLRQDTGIGSAALAQRQVGEEEMMVHDDDVALRCPPVHLGDKAAVPLLALLPDAAIGACIQLGPELVVFRKLLQLCPVAVPGHRLPFRDPP